MPPPRTSEPKGALPYAEALKGHQISTFIPSTSNTFKVFAHACTCGWRYTRQRLSVTDPKTKRVTRKAEPMETFRGAAAAHLYEIWCQARQGSLDV